MRKVWRIRCFLSSLPFLEYNLKFCLCCSLSPSIRLVYACFSVDMEMEDNANASTAVITTTTDSNNQLVLKVYFPCLCVITIGGRRDPPYLRTSCPQHVPDWSYCMFLIDSDRSVPPHSREPSILSDSLQMASISPRLAPTRTFSCGMSMENAATLVS